MGRHVSGDDEPPVTPTDLARSLREAADRLMSGWTGSGRAGRTGPDDTGPSAPGPLLPPATLSAAQLQVLLDDLAARRTQVQALRTQLKIFDDQLAALETSLGPLREWTRAWAGTERALTDLWRLPPTGPGR